MSSQVETRQQRRARTRADRKKAPRGLRALAGAGMLLAAGAMSAATITVNSLSDTVVASDGQCTLREALENANANGQTTGTDCIAGFGADAIVFQTGLTGTLTLTGGDLPISDATSITGPGTSVITISGNDSSRVFFVSPSGPPPIAVDLHDLTLTAGSAPAAGGAIFADGTDLVLDELVISDSTAATNGGGVAFDGAGGRTLTITDTRISGNSATATNALGGGLCVENGEGAILLQRDTFDGNQSGRLGGGVRLFLNGGATTIANCAITGNTSGTALQVDGAGGGLYIVSAIDDAVTITDCIISGNVADPNDGQATAIPGSDAADVGYGGAIWSYTAPLTIERTTISGNTAARGGGVVTLFQSNTFRELTIANNTASSPVIDGVGGGTFIIASETFMSGSTITGNMSETGGAGIDAGSMVVRNSIVANNTATSSTAPDVDANTVAANYTLIETPGTTPLFGTANLTGVDPNLGTLAVNGGTIVAGAPGTTQTLQTQLPLCGSPTIDAGDPAFVPPPATDERGLARVVGGRIDMGAVEVNAGTLEFSTTAQPVNEGAGTAVVTVTRTGGFDNLVSIDYATANGSAGTPDDYGATSGALNWADGDTADKSINVTIVDDNVFEGNETFTATLSGPSCGAAAGANTTHTITIVDNESQPAISIGDSSGSESITPRSFTVTLSGPSAQTITVDYATSDGSAGAGSDYTTAGGTLIFNPLDTVQTIDVTIANDTLDETDETFFASLTNAANATIADDQAQGTIEDDDGSPALSIDSPPQAEGNSGSVDLTFTVSLSAPSSQTVTVNYATADGTAAAGDDYTSTSGTLTFAPGETSQQIPVPILGDPTCEPDETYTVSLSSASNATIDTATGTATIANDDSCTADLAISKVLATPGPYVPGQNAVYTITVTNGGPAGATNVVVSDTLPPGTQFVSAVPSQGSCSGTAVVTCNLDAIADGANATVTLNVTFVGSGNISNTANVTSRADANGTNDAATANATVGAAAVGGVPALDRSALTLLAAMLALLGAAMMKKS